MANAYVEFGQVAAPVIAGYQSGTTAVHFTCAASEVLAISGSQANGAIAGGAGKTVARVSTDDTACYVAIGSTPNCDAVISTTATGARRYVRAGTTVEFAVLTGQKVSVKAVA